MVECGLALGAAALNAAGGEGGIVADVLVALGRLVVCAASSMHAVDVLALADGAACLGVVGREDGACRQGKQSSSDGGGDADHGGDRWRGRRVRGEGCGRE